MKHSVFASAASTGLLVALALTTRTAHAQWINDGATFIASESSQYVSNSSVAYNSGFGDADTHSITSGATSAAPKILGSNANQSDYFVQNFIWTAFNGEAPTTYFTVKGSGDLYGAVTLSGAANGYAASEVAWGGTNPGSSTWSSKSGKAALLPQGNVGVNASGTTATLYWALGTSCQGAAVQAIPLPGQPAPPPGGSFNCVADATYAFGSTNP